MDNYSKIFNKEWQRQMKEINDSINLSSGASRQVAELSQVIHNSGLINIQKQMAQMVNSFRIPSISYAGEAATASIIGVINAPLQQTAASIGQRYAELIGNLNLQFDFSKYTQNVLNQWAQTSVEIDDLESISKRLHETLEEFNSYITDKVNENIDFQGQKISNDNVNKAVQPQSEDIPRERYVLSQEEISKTCSAIDTIIYYPDTAIQKIGYERKFFEEHPIVCGIIIGVIAGILSGLAMAKLLSEPSQNATAVTKSINATVKESLDEPQKEKTKLPPGTSVIIVDETTPRYYEVEYTDPETGERKCGYVAKQCVIKNENVHEERVGD